MKIIYSLFFLTLMGLVFVPVNSLLYAQPPGSAFDKMDLDKEVKDSPLDPKLDAKQLKIKQEEMDKTFQENMSAQEELWGVLSKEMEAQWNEMVKRVNDQREALKKRVERQWDEFHDSTNREWVDYSPGMDSRSIVDFEKGEVEFSTLIPVDELPKNKEAQQEKAKELAEEKVVKQIKKVLSPDNEVKTEVLKDQIKDPEGKKVTKENVEKFVEKHVAPEMKVEEKPVVAKDGIPRVKVTVKVQMVPEHLKVRAERYKEQVNNYAARYNLDPALIYALIHTESYFNPLAKSYIPAFGLMQLVPKSGAMDAYYYLYKEKKILDPDYLFDPGNNVMLGATYFHILSSIYLAEVKEDSNKESLSIAAYNWGPGSIKTKIIKKHNVDSMTDDEVVALINKTAPQETIDYVSRVKTRKALYKSM